MDFHVDYNYYYYFFFYNTDGGTYIVGQVYYIQKMASRGDKKEILLK